LTGHETTSTAMCWTLYQLALNPSFQESLRQELNTALPNKDHEISWNQVNSIPILDAVVKESMRLIPPVPMTTRVAREDDVIDGYFIPKDTNIFLCPAITHQMKEYWGDDAEEFNPNRWISGTDGEAKPFGAYMPFLLGPRNCIGQKFAVIELKVILCGLVRNFKFEALEPKAEVKRKAAVTWKPDPFIELFVSKL
jgi:cytochrome P450